MKNIVYAVICFTLAVVYLFVFFLAWLCIFPFQKNRRSLVPFSRIYAAIFIFSSPWWRMRVKGLENIRKDKEYVMMINHQSMLDIPIISTINKNIRWVAKREVLNMPLINLVLLMRNDILVKRGTLSDTKKMLKRCRKELKQGVTIAIFPEGTRTKDGSISQFKEGAFVIAKLGNSDILPVVIEGSYDTTHPDKGWGFRFPSNITINILEPIPYESIKDKQIKEIKDDVRTVMVDYHKKLRPELYK